MIMIVLNYVCKYVGKEITNQCQLSNQSFVSVTFRESGHKTSYLKRAVTVLVGFMLFRDRYAINDE